MLFARTYSAISWPTASFRLFWVKVLFEAWSRQIRSTSYSSVLVSGRVTVPSRNEPCGEMAGRYVDRIDSSRSSQAPSDS
jgi:hypothetical protein